MTRRRKGRWTVFFTDAPPRDVYAYSEHGARRTAEAAQRLVGWPPKQCRSWNAKFLFFVGHEAQREAMENPLFHQGESHEG